MDINYIQLAIPFFFLAIVLEALYSGIAHKGWYDVHDSFNNLACGSLEQVVDGIVTLGDEPGLGAVPDLYALREFAVSH